MGGDPPVPGNSEVGKSIDCSIESVVADRQVGAPERLGDLLDEIITACPDATVLVAQIIQSLDPTTQARIQRYNNAMPKVVAQRADQGHHVMIVDMSSIGGNLLHTDGTHPTDAGYKKMADYWFAGIQAAVAKGWVKPPVGPDPKPTIANSNSGGQHCPASRDNALRIRNGPFPGHYCLGLPIWNPSGRLSHGVGQNGLAVFHPAWVAHGVVMHGIGKKGPSASSVQFVDMDANGVFPLFIILLSRSRNTDCWLERSCTSCHCVFTSG